MPLLAARRICRRRCRRYSTASTQAKGVALARYRSRPQPPPQPNIYLKRQHYLFERFYPVESTEGAGLVIDRDADKVFQFVKDEYLKGKKHSQNTLIQSKLLSQARVRAAVERLKADNRLIDEKITTGGQGGSRSFLRPMELPQ
ncbi:hypothetical protein [Pseudomonas aeruginosa]|uniref:hypothetical protein n=1 Tax=Pseudomonas aeruginosa TaxID=287 RepID=UPI001C2D7DFE|nr:hypothetical protein [Pseudomonas aeruginosa]MCV4187265.1 hypothetical protein [Pseudomonas aeruginosa]